MQKANVSVLVFVALAIAVLVAAEWYFFDYRQQAAAELDGLQSDHTVTPTSDLSGDTSQIIECEDSEGEKFYTNADSCEEAEPPLVETSQQNLPDG